jgi:hypothetical protein
MIDNKTLLKNAMKDFSWDKILKMGDQIDDKFIDVIEKNGMTTLPSNKKINKFIETHNLTDKYPAKELYRWHTLLTLSCQNGKNKFFEEHGYDLDKDEATLPEFFDAVANEYGGEIIEIVRKKMEEKENKKNNDK